MIFLAKHLYTRPDPISGRVYLYPVCFISCLASCILLLSFVFSHAAVLNVMPTRVSFESGKRVEKLVVKNSGNNDLLVQVSAFKWSQDGNGKDVYDNTSDIVIFPKILKVPAGEERFIRLGTSLRPASQEGTYRVYVEELPVENTKQDGAVLRFTLKFGIPVFVSPVKRLYSGTIEPLAIEKGKVSFRINNNGNGHFLINSIKITGFDERGSEAFSKSLNGWYVLGGSSKFFRADIPMSVCQKLSSVSVIVKTGNVSIEKSLNLTGGMCGMR